MQRRAGVLGRGDQRVGGHVGVRDAGRARGDGDQRLGCLFDGFSCGLGLFGRSDSARRRPARRPRSDVFALRSDSTKSLRTRARARLDSSFMCSAPPDSGAAIRNARSAGPSGAPKSTAGFSRAKPMEAVSTYGERQCGIAMPPGSPVADCSSRAIAAAISPSVSCVRPASASRLTSRPMTVCLSPPASTSSRTRSVLMIGCEAVLVMAILSCWWWVRSGRSVSPARH